MPKRHLSRLSVYDYSKLVSAFKDASIKESCIPKLFSQLCRNPDVPWSEVPELPKAAAQLLDARFQRSTSRVVSKHVSGDGETTKLVVELQDGMQVEAVIMVYDTTARYTSEDGSAAQRGQRRATLCVSSQVGCQMGCTFCATGTMGLKGDLTAGEVLEQLVHAQRVMPIRNVVFMGMGEPMNNYTAVREAVGIMTDSKFFGLRRTAVTVSTVGVVPRIRQLATDLPGVSLALSLHAPNQALRQTLVPSARAYKLDSIMQAVQQYQQQAKHPKVFVEYVLLAGVNDQQQHAHELGQLLSGHGSYVVNLIPWNPIFSPGIAYSAPGADATSAFQRIVREQYGLPCTVRQEKGQDIGGACGQLVVELAAGRAGAPGGPGCGPPAQGGKGQGVVDIEELARGGARAAAVPVGEA